MILKTYFIIWTIIVFAPFLMLATLFLLSYITGCDVHEGFVQACQIWIFDIGELLYALGVSGWFILLSLVLGPIGYLVLSSIFVIKNTKNKSK